MINIDASVGIASAVAYAAQVGYKSGTELNDSLTLTEADLVAYVGASGLGGADTITLGVAGNYFGGWGSDSFVLGSGMAGQYTVVGSEPGKVRPYQHVAPVDDFDTINIGGVSVTTIDLTAGRISGTSGSTPYNVNFSGIERIIGATSPAGHVVTGRTAVAGFQFFPSGSDQISLALGVDQPWNAGISLLYSRGNFLAAGITLSYNAQGVGRVTSPAFPGATGDTLERVVAIAGTAASDVFDMTYFGTNAAGTKMNIVGVSAGDTVIGNGETRLLLPGFSPSGISPSGSTSLTLPDFTRRVVVDLTAGSLEAYTSNATNSNFNTWAGAVKFSGVQGLYGSSQDETMLGDERDNFFRTEDGNDYVDGRGGIDTLDYWRQAEPITIDMAAGTAQGGPSNGADSFRRIEMVTGTVYADLYDASEFGTAKAVNVGDRGSYNAFRPLGGDDVVVGNGQTHVLYDISMLAVEVNLAEGYGRARVASERLITDDRGVGTDRLVGVNRVTGTVFADSLTGDASNNVLEGGAGNDTLSAGAGEDVAVYAGKRTDYTVTPGLGGQVTVTDNRAAQIQDAMKGTWSLNEGVDVLSGIETLRFADGDLALDGTTQTFTQRAEPSGPASALLADPFTAAQGYKRGTELSDGSLTYTASDKASGATAGIAGLGGADTFTLSESGSYVGGSGPDLFNLASGLSGTFTVVGSEPGKVQPYQHVAPVDDFDAINVGSASITTIDLTAGRISGTGGSTPYTVNFSGIERINGATSPAGHVVTGRAAVAGFQYFPSGSDQISLTLGADQPWNPGISLSYARGSFWAAGITLSYNAQGVGRVTSPAFPGATGDTLERVVAIAGTAASDVFDMTHFGTNAAGTKMNIVGVSAGDTVIGNGETRLLLPGFSLGAGAPSAGTFTTLLDFTRRIVVDLATGRFEAHSSSSANSMWAGAVKFSGVQGLYGSSQDETMLGDERNNFFRTEDGNDYVDGRGGIDTLDYWRQAEPVTIDMAAGTTVGGPSNGVDSFRRIEIVTGTVYADRYDASRFGGREAVNVGDQGAYNAFRPSGGDDVVIGNGQTHVLYDISMLAVEVNLDEGFARARVASERLITDDRGIGLDRLSGVNSVTGTVFGDSLIGDGDDNIFEGGAGLDTIYGGAGRDVAAFSGPRSAYTIQSISVDQFVVIDTRSSQIEDPLTRTLSLNDGTDQLSGIEVLRFADGELSLNANLDFRAFDVVKAAPVPLNSGDPLLGYKRGSELNDLLTLTEVDRANFVGVAGLGGADTFNLEASGSYVGGSGPDTFNLGSALSGTYVVSGRDTLALPFQLMFAVDDFDVINLNSAGIASIDVSAGRINGADGAFSVQFSGVERIVGASSPAGHVLTGTASWMPAFQYMPSGNDRITLDLNPKQPWLSGPSLFYNRGGFNTSGITVTYDQQGIGTVSSPAYPTAGGDRLERVASVTGTLAADVFDMRNFGTNSAGNRTNLVGVSAGDTVIGNGDTRMMLPGYQLSATLATSTVTLPDFTRRVVVDLTEGSFEAYTLNVTNNNFNGWAGAVTFSGVRGLYGSSQDETMLGDERDNFFRTEDGNDFVDGRGGVDTLDYWRQAEPIAIDMAAGTAICGPSSGIDEFRRVEVVTGTLHADLYDASRFGTTDAVNVGDQGAYNAYRPIGGNDVVIGNGQTHVLYDMATLPVEVNLAQGYARARLESDRQISDERNVGQSTLSGVNRMTGSVFADSLTGDGTDNTIEGGAGNDTIVGGAGQDTAIFSGARSYYMIHSTVADGLTVTDMRAAQIHDAQTGTFSLNDGVDQLIGIEKLRFADSEVSVQSLGIAPSRLSGVVYHWKSHAVLDQVEARAVSVSDVVASPGSWFDLRAASYDYASGTAHVEVWINPTSSVESLGFSVAGPVGSSMSFTRSLGPDWMLLTSAGLTDKLRLSALISDVNMPGLGQSTQIGILSIKIPSGQKTFDVHFTEILNGESPVPDHSLTLESATMSDGSGRYAFQSLADGQMQLTVGRPADDGRLAVTAADAVAAMRIALGLNPNADPDGSGPRTKPAVSPYQVMAADVDASGKVNAADVLAILKMSVGAPAAPMSEWLFVEEARDFWNETTKEFVLDRDNATWGRTINAGQPGQANLVGVLKGDVTGSWQASAERLGLDLLSPGYFQELSTLIGAPLDQWHA